MDRRFQTYLSAAAVFNVGSNSGSSDESFGNQREDRNSSCSSNESFVTATGSNNSNSKRESLSCSNDAKEDVFEESESNGQSKEAAKSGPVICDAKLDNAKANASARRRRTAFLAQFLERKLSLTDGTTFGSAHKTSISAASLRRSQSSREVGAASGAPRRLGASSCVDIVEEEEEEERSSIKRNKNLLKSFGGGLRRTLTVGSVAVSGWNKSFRSKRSLKNLETKSSSGSSSKSLATLARRYRTESKVTTVKVADAYLRR